MKTHTFHVQGMHCKACVALIESELVDVPEVSKAKSSLADHSVEVVGDFGDKTVEHIARDLSEVLKPHGYAVSLTRQRHSVAWSDFKIAVPVAGAFIALFIILQKLGIVNLVNTSEVGYGTAFVIGLIASVSTCMAVVGGLVLSMSATFAKEGDTVRPAVLFHIGRLVSFFVLGGVIGALGSVFTLSITLTFVLSLVVGVVMLILGINLLDVFHDAKRLQLSMPNVVTKHTRALATFNHTATPVLLGIATFFLPCGFTQSMQLYTLSTGSFMTGGLTMLVFALGTLPVLALISFSSVRIHGALQSSIFFKTAGLVIIAFAVFNVINSLVIIGLLSPVFTF